MTIQISEEMNRLVKGFRFPAYNEIPDVGLYLEQAGKYINTCLQPLTGSELTGSMISNYVKKKIISNPVKKLYYRDQLAALFFITLAKTVTPLPNAKRLMDLAEEEFTIREVYEKLGSIFEDMLKSVFLQSAEPETEEESETMRLLRHLVKTIVFKIYLDCCFAETDEESHKGEAK